MEKAYTVMEDDDDNNNDDDDDDDDEGNNVHGDVNLLVSWRTVSQRMLHRV